MFVYIKKAFVLFCMFCAFLYGGNFSFSLDSGASNIANNLEFYIYTDYPLNPSSATSDKFKSAISLERAVQDDEEEDSDTQTIHKVDFNISIQDNNQTIKLSSLSLLNSDTKYTITINGSTISDIYSQPFGKHTISFTSGVITKIILSDQNITVTRGLSKDIYASLDSFLGNDSYIAYPSSKYIKVYPLFMRFNQLNWDDPQKITISSPQNSEYINDSFYVDFVNTKSGFTRRVNVKVEDKISATFSKKSIATFKDTAIVQLVLSNFFLDSKKEIRVKVRGNTQNIRISPKTLTFNYDNWRIPQSVVVGLKTNTKPQDFIFLFTLPQDELGIVSQNIFINFINPSISDLPIHTIRSTKVGSLSTSIIWSLPDALAYNVVYRVYASSDPLEYNNESLITTTIENRTVIALSPNKTYNIGIQAQYKIQNLATNIPISKTSAYQPIQVTTNKVQIADNNKNLIIDDIEELLESDQYGGFPDRNNDKIPDALQQYVASIFSSKNYAAYSDYKDSDGDKMPDLLEVSVGRSPSVDDFHQPDKPVINFKSQTGRIFTDGKKLFSQISGVTAKDGYNDISYKIKAYYSTPCFTNSAVPYTIFKNECQEVKLDGLTFEKDIKVHWVVFDDDHNMAYETRSIKLFKAEKTISYRLSNFGNSIKSLDPDVLFALGDYSKTFSENNISLPISKVLLSEEEARIFDYQNNIFDFRAFRLGNKRVDIVIPHIRQISSTDTLRIYRGFQWIEFDTSGGDKIFSSLGFNKKCNIGEQYYKEGIIDGAYCLKIRVKDGSLNDANIITDGVFHFTGGVATQKELVTFDTNPSSACSSLNARGFDKIEKQKTKIDPLLPIMLIISLIFALRGFARR